MPSLTFQRTQQVLDGFRMVSSNLGYYFGEYKIIISYLGPLGCRFVGAAGPAGFQGLSGLACLVRAHTWRPL